MASIWALLACEGKIATIADPSVLSLHCFYFRGAKQLYADATWQEVTGIKDVTATHLNADIVISEVGDLVLHGIIRNAELEIRDSNKKLIGIRKIRYAGTKATTIENKVTDTTAKGLNGITWAGVLKGAPSGCICEVIEKRTKLKD
jgi:hypothetical protein